MTEVARMIQPRAYLQYRLRIRLLTLPPSTRHMAEPAMSTSTNQKPMWQVSFGPAPGRCHVATSTLTFLDTSAPLRKCTRRFEPPHGGTAARPPPLFEPPHGGTAARPPPLLPPPLRSRCEGRPLHHHPAPPRPSVKRTTSPPLPLPHLVDATPPTPIVPDHHERYAGHQESH